MMTTHRLDILDKAELPSGRNKRWMDQHSVLPGAET